jgi:hypothetical protein
MSDLASSIRECLERGIFVDVAEQMAAGYANTMGIETGARSSTLERMRERRVVELAERFAVSSIGQDDAEVADPDVFAAYCFRVAEAFVAHCEKRAAARAGRPS